MDICGKAASKKDIAYKWSFQMNVGVGGEYNFRAHLDWGAGTGAASSQCASYNFQSKDDCNAQKGCKCTSDDGSGVCNTCAAGGGGFVCFDGDCQHFKSVWGFVNFKQTLLPGVHTVTGLGFENCCDGRASVQVALPIFCAGAGTKCANAKGKLVDITSVSSSDYTCSVGRGHLANQALTFGCMDFKTTNCPYRANDVHNAYTCGSGGLWANLQNDGKQFRDHFATSHQGFVKIPVADKWTFTVISDDGSQLFMDTTKLVDNDGLHSMRAKSGTKYLTAGMHAIYVTFFERGGGAGLIVRWASPGSAKGILPVIKRTQSAIIPNAALFTKHLALCPNKYQLEKAAYTVGVGTTNSLSSVPANCALNGVISKYYKQPKALWSKTPMNKLPFAGAVPTWAKNGPQLTKLDYSLEFGAICVRSGSYSGALTAFNSCSNKCDAAARKADLSGCAGFCHKELDTAQMLSNQQVCESTTKTNIGFHMRLPFKVWYPGTYRFRFQADFGRGGYVGIDGTQGRSENIWSEHLRFDAALTAGDHYFEALGFEDCCDGDTWLKVRLPCDADCKDQCQSNGQTYDCDKVPCATDPNTGAAMTDNVTGKCTKYQSIQKRSPGACWRDVASGRNAALVQSSPNAATCEKLPAGSIVVKGEVSVAVDNAYKLFLNGQEQGSGQSWSVADTYKFQAPVTKALVVAIDGVDAEQGRGGVGAIMAQVRISTPHSVGFVTDANDWWCWTHGAQAQAGLSAKPPKGWNLPSFTPTVGGGWAHPSQYGRNDDPTTVWHRVKRGDIKGISPNAQWIWTADKDKHNDVYCRLTIPITKRAPALSFGKLFYESRRSKYTIPKKLFGGPEKGYAAALASFNKSPRPDGKKYCRATLKNAEHLRNADICKGGSTRDLVYKYTMDIKVGFDALYRFRWHVDWGRNGGFTCFDGVCYHHTGNVWGYVYFERYLKAGSVKFEAIGFEGCCDGWSSLQVAIPTECNTAKCANSVVNYLPVGSDQHYSCPAHGAAFGDLNPAVKDTTGQDVVFGCIDYKTSKCTTSMKGTTLNSARQAIINCRQMSKAAKDKGYCQKILTDTSKLRNQDVCNGGKGNKGSARNIGFHIRIPFRVNVAGKYHFRYHVDMGKGGWIGVDNPTYHGGNIWGHVTEYDKQLAVGDHLLEAIGVEGCCDGCGYFEMMLPCDTKSTGVSKTCGVNRATCGSGGSGSKTDCGNWRIIVAGAHPSMKCGRG